MKLGLREANQHFSKAIKAVRTGKEVVLTERGRPIAVIKPIKREATEEAALQAAFATSPLRRAKGLGTARNGSRSPAHPGQSSPQPSLALHVDLLRETL